MIARHLVVRGRVQGVGFRWWTADTARDAGLIGWVRNRADGTVEIVAQGEGEAVERLVRACHAGPAAARVEAVAVTSVDPMDMTGFVQRPTA